MRVADRCLLRPGRRRVGFRSMTPTAAIERATLDATPRRTVLCGRCPSRRPRPGLRTGWRRCDRRGRCGCWSSTTRSTSPTPSPAGLRRDGYAVDVANDGESALDKADLTPYDLICLDLTMPELDGLEVCRRIRARSAPDDTAAGPDADRARQPRRPRRRPRQRRRRLPGQALRVPRAGGPGPDAAAPRGQHGARRSSSSATCRSTRRRHEVRRGDEPLDLTAKEFALLRYFMTRARRGAVARRSCSTTSGTRTPTPSPTRSGSRSGRCAASSTRQPTTEPLIETVIGRGYRLRPDAAAGG